MRCFSPLSIVRPGATKSADRITVPCGKCAACLQNRRSAWSFRLNEELKASSFSSFITLTYDDENLPNPPFLQRHDLTLFLKRLREHQVRKVILPHSGEKVSKIKYYAVGEYGGRFGRPHYHIILFNCSPRIDIQKIWNKGMVHVGKVTSASIHYVTGYVINDSDELEIPKNVREFSVMSKNLGISYLNNYLWNKKELRDYVISKSGHRQNLPRYYRDKIFNVVEKIGFANEKQKYADELFFKEIENENYFVEQIAKNNDYARRIRKKKNDSNRIKSI